MLEYIDGGILFDLVQSQGKMGEEAGRYFIHQLTDVLQYITSNTKLPKL
jgi:serine/threonine protein kinase